MEYDIKWIEYGQVYFSIEKIEANSVDDLKYKFKEEIHKEIDEFIDEVFENQKGINNSNFTWNGEGHGIEIYGEGIEYKGSKKEIGKIEEFKLYTNDNKASEKLQEYLEKFYNQGE